jgi:hypothetical protein
MRSAAEATQALYYPEMIDGAGGAPGEHRGLNRRFGRLRYGRLLEALLYDCRAHVTSLAGAERDRSCRPRSSDGCGNARSERTPTILCTCPRHPCSGPQGNGSSGTATRSMTCRVRSAGRNPVGIRAGAHSMIGCLRRAVPDRGPRSGWAATCTPPAQEGYFAPVRHPSATMPYRAALRQPRNSGARLAVQLPGRARHPVPQPGQRGLGSPGREERLLAPGLLARRRVTVSLYQWAPDQGVEAIDQLRPSFTTVVSRVAA